MKHIDKIIATRFYKPILQLLAISVLLPVLMTGCKKILDVPPPSNSITADLVFSNADQASSAIAGMFYKMINTPPGFATYGMTVFGGMSADELIPFNQSNQNYAQFYNNSLVSTNSVISSNFWNNAYSVIYSANSIIEGLNNSKGVNESVKSRLTGQAEFARAFCNFYLVNLFGDIPLVTTINYNKTSLLYRTPLDQVYQAILADLKDAQIRLAADYSEANGQRVIPNKWVATALLARIYLYLKDYKNAEIQASSLINNATLFSLSLLTGPNEVFATNSNEAIWQLQQDNSGGTSSYNATPEGFAIIPRALNSIYQPLIYLTPALLNSFEAGDQRKINWVDSTKYNNKFYYFPYKYKVGPGQAVINGPYSEYYMVLRLAEQYLIRAEARAQLGESGAIDDLNAIRNRAGLPDYTGPTDRNSLLTAIAHENQIEFFAEWGHRWLDLKRWGTAAQVLSVDKGLTVSTNSLLYPIPVSELRTDPNLIQNPGY